MTAPDLTALADKLDELAMKATPGKIDWHRRYTNDDGSEERNGSVFASVREGTATAIAMQPKYTVYPQWEADASLIAATLNNLPTLTTALREAARLRGVASNADRAMRFVKLVASQRLSEQAIAWYGGEFGEDGEPDFEGAYDSFIEQARSIWSDIERAALESPRG